MKSNDKPYNPQKPHVNLIALSLLMIFTLLFTGCTKPPIPIVMFDMNQISTITLNVLENPSDLPITTESISFDKPIAKDTENFMLLKFLVAQYEKDLFNHKKEKVDLNSPLPIDSLAQEKILCSLEVKNESISLNEYNIIIDSDLSSGFFMGNNHQIALTEDMISSIVYSDLLPIKLPEPDMPKMDLTYLDTSYQAIQEGQWNQFIYTKRYMNFSIETSLTDNSISNSDSNTVTSVSKDDYLSLSDEASQKVEINFSSQPSALEMTLYRLSSNSESLNKATTKPFMNEMLVPEANGTYRLPVLSDNGYYKCELKAQWENSSNNSNGEFSYSFDLAVELNESFTLNKSDYQPGDLIAIKGNYIDSDLNYLIDSTIYNENLHFIESDGSYYILLPILSKASVGEYTVTVTDLDYPETPIVIPFSIVNKVFEVQELTVSSTTASLQNQDNYIQLNEAFERGRSTEYNKKLWDDVFIQPVNGRISTEYGQIRITNGETTSRHSGMDIANKNGTPVVATQNGYVTLAEKLNITGNTLFINHGFGIISQYYHLNYIDVNVGDYVTVGQYVADIGTTGYSTGPHLHFCIYNNGIYLNPWKLFENAPF